MRKEINIEVLKKYNKAAEAVLDYYNIRDNGHFYVSHDMIHFHQYYYDKRDLIQERYAYARPFMEFQADIVDDSVTDDLCRKHLEKINRIFEKIQKKN